MNLPSELNYIALRRVIFGIFVLTLRRYRLTNVQTNNESITTNNTKHHEKTICNRNDGARYSRSIGTDKEGFHPR